MSFCANVRNALAAIVAAFLTAACCDEGVHSVDLYISHGAQTTYLWPGDTTTAYVIAGTDSKFPCYHELYNSKDRPDAFSYQLSDSSVVTISKTGLMTARKLGVSTVAATSVGVHGIFLPVVIVVPPVASIRLTMAPASMRVGDTVSINVDALDDGGRAVPNAQLAFYLARTLDSVAVFVSAPSSTRPYASVPAPRAVRVRALRTGSFTFVAQAPRGAAGFGVTDSVRVTVAAALP